MLTVAGNRGPMMVMTKGVQEVMIRLYFHFLCSFKSQFPGEHREARMVRGGAAGSG